MKVKKIDHVTIRVKDLEEARKFFTEVFGIEFGGINVSKEQDLRYYSSDLGITLHTPLSPDGAPARALEQRGEGVSVLSLQVANLPEAAAEMKARGIRQIAGAGKTLAVFHPRDLYGVMVELIQRE
ncbi:MAG: VOC family protein [Chloroflexi bacterium]|nr:VOC family protein [Chloroflexota bacterium]